MVDFQIPKGDVGFEQEQNSHEDLEVFRQTVGNLIKHLCMEISWSSVINL
jgi:hypothetical protein